MRIKEILKKSWDFLREDSWSSLIVTLVLAFIIIKYVFFPLLSFLTGTSLPLVIVESCSMYHSTNIDDVLKNPIYSQNGISLDDSKSWPFQYGLGKGDVVFAVGAKNVKVGDVIIFQADTAYPIIHRVIKIDNGLITTKGDHNRISIPGVEESISQDRLIGKAVFRVPFVGWAKLIFYEFSRNPSERGLCV